MSTTTPFFPSSSRSPPQLPVSRGRDQKSPPQVGGISTGCACVGPTMTSRTIPRTSSHAQGTRGILTCRRIWFSFERTCSRLHFEGLFLRGQGDRRGQHAPRGAEGFPQEQGLDGSPCQGFDLLLQLGDFLRVLVGEVGLLRGVLRQVEEFDARRQRRLPHQFPLPLAYGAAEGFDVVDDLAAG